MRPVSKPDLRSTSIVAMFVNKAIHEARMGRTFKAGCAIGSAEQAIAEIDNQGVRDRAELLVNVVAARLESALALRLPLDYGLAAE